MSVEFERVAQRLYPHGKLRYAVPLTGGVSAQIHLLEVLLPDGTTPKLIVRQYGAADVAHNPHIAFYEYRLLRHLHSAGIAVPDAYHYAETGDGLPAPYIVIEYIAGHTRFAFEQRDAALMQLAAHLAKIHRVSTNSLTFLTPQSERYAALLAREPTTLDENLQEGTLRNILNKAKLVQRNPLVILHGDYWLGNVLWRGDEQLAAIIDWEDAALGDPLADVGNARLEIMWALGEEAMQTFTAAYRAQMPDLDYGDLPYWDLYAALRPAGKLSGWFADDEPKKINMQHKHRRFVTLANVALRQRE